MKWTRSITISLYLFEIRALPVGLFEMIASHWQKRSQVLGRRQRYKRSIFNRHGQTHCP